MVKSQDIVQERFAKHCWWQSSKGRTFGAVANGVSGAKAGVPRLKLTPGAGCHGARADVVLLAYTCTAATRMRRRDAGSLSSVGF